MSAMWRVGYDYNIVFVGKVKEGEGAMGVVSVDKKDAGLVTLVECLMMKVLQIFDSELFVGITFL